MPSTLFKAFHVYPINRKHPVGARFPFEYIMCFTRAEFNQPQNRFNVIGFPVLTQPESIPTDRRLRFQLRTTTTDAAGELVFAKPPILALDLLQPIPNTLLIDNSIGQLMQVEITELKSILSDFLALP